MQDALGLTLEQKLAIVEVRRDFLGRMQGVVRARAALQGALQRPVPAQYSDGSALNAFAETSVALEERLRALAAEEGEAFNLMAYGVRQARAAALMIAPKRASLHVHLPQQA